MLIATVPLGSKDLGRAFDEIGLPPSQHLRTELVLTTDLACCLHACELFQYDTRLELGLEGASLSFCLVPFPGLIVFELTDLSSFWGPLRYSKKGY